MNSSIRRNKNILDQLYIDFINISTSLSIIYSSINMYKIILITYISYVNKLILSKIAYILIFPFEKNPHVLGY